LNDGRLQKEFYTRSYEQDDELGLNDMRVENYEELDPLKEEEEEDEVDENASNQQME
jgi:zinc finger protein